MSVEYRQPLGYVSLWLCFELETPNMSCVLPLLQGAEILQKAGGAQPVLLLATSLKEIALLHWMKGTRIRWSVSRQLGLREVSSLACRRGLEGYPFRP